MATNQLKISVILAAYNAETYLALAIDSVLHQSLIDWELLIVNDGSTDSSLEIIENYALKDNRIIVINNLKNMGLAASLNRGIEIAKGQYVARMDADDIALPDRLERQVAFFDANPDHYLLGGNAIYIDEAGRETGQSSLPLHDREIRGRCLFHNPFIHPATMMRSDLFKSNSGARYDTSFDTTQDWILWLECLKRGKVANLAEPVIKQRMHNNSISVQKRARQIENSLRVQEKYCREFLGPSVWDRNLFYDFNTVFLNDRVSADNNGTDRIAVCHRALDLFKTISPDLPRDTKWPTSSYIVQRCIIMGLMPPIKTGWLGLLRHLLRCHFIQFCLVTVETGRRKLFK